MLGKCGLHPTFKFPCFAVLGAFNNIFLVLAYCAKKTVEDQKVTDIAASYDADTLREGIILRRGKKNFNKVVLR